MFKTRKILFQKTLVSVSFTTIAGIQKKACDWVEDDIIIKMIEEKCKLLNIKIKKIKIKDVFSQSLLTVKCTDEKYEMLINQMKNIQGIKL